MIETSVIFGALEGLLGSKAVTNYPCRSWSILHNISERRL
jgi:hypothetical protein